MTRAFDVVVLGGGVMGLFTALDLARRGRRVALLEKRFLGAGSSGKSGAILRQHYSHAVTVRLAREGLFYYRDFAAKTGHDIGFQRTGMLFLCDAAQRSELERNVAVQRAEGVEVEILEAPALRALDPRGSFGDDCIGAHEPAAGFVDPWRVVQAAGDLCRAAGVDLREGERATAIRVEAGRAVGVETASGEALDAPVVVNACGPWARDLCAAVGVDVPLRVIRPEQAFFSPPAGDRVESFIGGDLEWGHYWKPEPSGFTRIGCLSYDRDLDVPDPDHYDEGVSGEFLATARAALEGRIPAYARSLAWGGGSALYTVTPDSHALIGEVRSVPGLWLVAGFSGHGFKLGPAIGRGLAGLIEGEPRAAFDEGLFALDRFERGEELGSTYRYGVLG